MAEHGFAGSYYSVRRFVARLPRPKAKDGPITYYVEAQAFDGSLRRTPPFT